MGERTQLFINVKDEKGKKVAGTVIHFQWGVGHTMLLQALTLLKSFPLSYELHDDDEKCPLVDNVIKNVCGLENAVMARNLVKEINNRLINGTTNIYESDSKLEYELDNIITAEKFGEITHNEANKKKAVWQKCIDEKFNATENNFYEQCDNNDGFMIMDLQYEMGRLTGYIKFISPELKEVTLYNFATKYMFLEPEKAKAFQTLYGVK